MKRTADVLKQHFQLVLFSTLFKVNHTVLLSTLGDSSYRFGATYVGTKQMGPAEVRCRKVTVSLICKMFVFFLLYELFIECSLLLVQFFPVMVGDMDNSGSLNAQIIHQISSGVRSKLAFQVNR